MMQTTGSRTDRPTPRRAVVLAASLALVVNLLAPMIGGMLSAALAADGVWIQICTTDGIEYRRIDFDGDTGGETEPAQSHFGDCQACAHCSVSCGKKDFARAAVDWPSRALAAGEEPRADNPAVRSPAAARGILKRAPPVV